MSSVSVLPVRSKFVNEIKVLKRVVGYARVSTLSYEQESSYENQVLELEKIIKDNDNYEFICVFSDKESGTTQKREGFQTMINLARNKEIDVIVTKSISRFGRDTVSTVGLVNELKSLGVEVRFLKENMSSFDVTSDFLLSILAMHAEEESRSISTNLKWSNQKRMQSGANLTNNLYGYRIDKGVGVGNRKYNIYEPEAKVVRMIFRLYMEGNTYKQIIEHLHSLGIKSSTGNEYWYKSTLEGMLKNEKYMGDVLYNKTYLVSTRNRKINNNVITKYYASYDHEGIIDRITFEKVQTIRKERYPNNKSHKSSTGESSKYINFLFSIENQKHMQYVVEKHKGKYAVETLYCYHQIHKNSRRMIQVSNLLNILHLITVLLSKSAYDFYFKYKTILENEIKSLDDKLDNTPRYKFEYGEMLTNRCSIKNSIEKLLSLKSTLLKYKEPMDITFYRELYSKVYMVNPNELVVSLSLMDAETKEYNSSENYLSFDFEYLKYKVPTIMKVHLNVAVQINGRCVLLKD
jgi:DNA invertase Pin-like site-specific DNA recombinase